MSLIIFEGLLGDESEHSFLEHNKAFQHFAEVGVLRRVRVPQSHLRESMFLGFEPDEVSLAQGPLMVSALGFDPPTRSVHFHLSLLSVKDEILTVPTEMPTAQELGLLKIEADRLKTKLLTLLIGQGIEHGLVWEKLGEFLMHSPNAVEGKKYTDVLPEGDGEREVRRLIDDSLNILSNLDFNRRRVDHGKSPLNVFWPWGAGMRASIPNLALRYGYPHEILSDSLRMNGLARLAGFRFKTPRQTESELEIDLENIGNAKPPLAVLNTFASLRKKSMLEEADWLAHQVGERLVEPMLDYANDHNEPLTVVATNSTEGLLVHFRGKPADNIYPFDERTLVERKVGQVDVSEVARRALST